MLSRTEAEKIVQKELRVVERKSDVLLDIMKDETIESQKKAVDDDKGIIKDKSSKQKGNFSEIAVDATLIRLKEEENLLKRKQRPLNGL